MPVPGYLSTDTTVLSNLSLTGQTRASTFTGTTAKVQDVVTNTIQAASTALFSGTVIASSSLNVTSGVFSSKTQASSVITNGNSIQSNEMIFTMSASGASLVLRSGNTLWVFGSTVSAAATG